MDCVNIHVGRKAYRMVQSKVFNAEIEATSISIEGVIDHFIRR